MTTRRVVVTVETETDLDLKSLKTTARDSGQVLGAIQQVQANVIKPKRARARRGRK